APRLIGRTKGGLTSKLHVVCDRQGRPVRLHLSEGQCSDFTGADVLLRDLPEASVLIGKGYDSNKIRTMLLAQGITPCIPARRNRNRRMPYSKRLYKLRHKVENLFAKLKDWRRIATRYDRCAHIFLSAVLLGATLIFWL
ncbi:MAG: IS5 family transposase, partial [Cyanobacteria bacterium MAG CAR1_bin_15]|nr:IS5 family transposase [Cyanobacteria bacterium MAG CAR1_bin_15]